MVRARSQRLCIILSRVPLQARGSVRSPACPTVMSQPCDDSRHVSAEGRSNCITSFHGAPSCHSHCTQGRPSTVRFRQAHTRCATPQPHEPRLRSGVTGRGQGSPSGVCDIDLQGPWELNSTERELLCLSAAQATTGDCTRRVVGSVATVTFHIRRLTINCSWFVACEPKYMVHDGVVRSGGRNIPHSEGQGQVSA